MPKAMQAMENAHKRPRENLRFLTNPRAYLREWIKTATPNTSKTTYQLPWLTSQGRSRCLPAANPSKYDRSRLRIIQLSSAITMAET